MKKIIINREIFRDKVMGCWLGKNAGGTLGEPLEGKFGKYEMFNVDWYPSLPEGGIPNDDLELQLIWLQLILKKGPGLTSEDFVEAWLDCIAYNFDEYGLSKENMQKGLLPPVCGWNNNSFKDCMGSPIRSELWACLAPGNPKVAAHYAFLDAIVDHGGGESVFGECFNTVLESNAFICSDKFLLLQSALDSIPSSCLTYKSVKLAIENFKCGMSYIDNRNDLLKHFYNPISQYSPLNLGFQTIGWLYGKDFGDAICKATNCGWDTDCTAATLGALLGIIGGASSLPEKWIQPLGYEIATNMRTGGIRNLTAPTNIKELTEVVCNFSEEVASYWGSNPNTSDSKVMQFSDSESMTEITEPSSVSLKEFDNYQPNTISYHLGTLEESVSYTNDAFILGNRVSEVVISIVNNHPIKKTISIEMILPEGFKCENENSCYDIEANEKLSFRLRISASDRFIKETNKIYLLISSKEEPAIPAVPIVLLGGSKWLISKFYSDATIDSDCNIPEATLFSEPPKGFTTQWNPGNDLKLDKSINGSGVIYALHYVYSNEAHDVVLGVPNTGRMKLFLNGKMIHTTKSVVPLRANLGNGGALGDLNNYIVTVLEKGWNQILIKMQNLDLKKKDGSLIPYQAHFTIGGMSTVCYKNHGMPVLGINRSLFSWEKENE